MAVRIEEQDVRDIVETDPSIKLFRFIKMANVVTDRVRSGALDREPSITLTTEELFNIEALLAAHFYSTRDQRYTARSTGQSSGSFVESSYLEDAKLVDYSGTLAAIAKGSRAVMISLRTPHSQDRCLD